jgi:putative CocE/NonD family hydrolase
MRDGVTLFTAVYRPKDRSENYPFLLVRTPYSIQAYGDDFLAPDSYLLPWDEMLKEGYILVYQDVRGAYMSEGEYTSNPWAKHLSDPAAVDDSTDAWDTIDWLIKNIPGNNGRVGTWGGSAMGRTTVLSLVNPHTALKAASPQAAPADQFVNDDVHHNGAFRLAYEFWWNAYAARSRPEPGTPNAVQKPFRYGTPWGYEFFLNAGPTHELNDRYFDGELEHFQNIVEHPDYDDYWYARNILKDIGRVDVPVLNVAGWFDPEDFAGPISIYGTIEQRNADNRSTLVVGPWAHGFWALTKGRTLGALDFGADTSAWYQANLMAPFFAHHLKGKGEWTYPEAVVFENGRNRWHTLDQWPPADIEWKPLYFRNAFQLSFSPPDGEGKDSYLSDPQKPVPFTDKIVTRPTQDWMVEDQRWASTRPDVLTYVTEPLASDVSIAGPVLANLFVSSTGTDSDFLVKLIDVYPGDAKDPDPNPEGLRMGGYQLMVGAEIMRARYRDSLSQPTPLVPDEVTPLSYKIWDRFHTFRKGHRIMVQVQSSWFPAYDRNPQQFVNTYTAGPEDYQAAWQTLHRAPDAASHFLLPVWKGSESSASAEQVDAAGTGETSNE